MWFDAVGCYFGCVWCYLVLFGVVLNWAYLFFVLRGDCLLMFGVVSGMSGLSGILRVVCSSSSVVCYLVLFNLFDIVWSVRYFYDMIGLF